MVRLIEEIEERADELREALRNGLVIEAETFPDPADIFDDTPKVHWFIRLEGGTEECVCYNEQNGSTSLFSLDEMEQFVDAYEYHAEDTEVEIRRLDELPEVVRRNLLSANTSQKSMDADGGGS